METKIASAFSIGYNSVLLGEDILHVPFATSEEVDAYRDGLREASEQIASLSSEY